VRVHPDHAGFDGVRDAVPASQVVRPDVGRQVVPGGVGQFDDLGFAVEGRDRDNRAES
jgi:hypothetical protein